LVERILDILNELKIPAAVLVVVLTVWIYARAQRLQQQADRIHYWPSIAPPLRVDRDPVASADTSSVDE
jgi:hypothetical protein